MRKKLILEFFDRGKALNLRNKEYHSYISKLFNSQLNEDIDKGDITTDSLIGKSKKIRAAIIAKQEGIVAGIEESKIMTKNEKIKILQDEFGRIKIFVGEIEVPYVYSFWFSWLAVHPETELYQGKQ